MKKKTKKRMVKWLATCLAMVLVWAMGLTSLAEKPSTLADLAGDFKGIITVQNLDKGTTVSLYPIISVNLSGNNKPENPLYQWDDNVAAWLRKNGYEQYVNSDGSVSGQFNATDVPEVNATEVWEKMAAAIKNGRIEGITSNESAVVSSDEGSVTFTEKGLGVYLLTAKGGVNIYQPTVVSFLPKYNEDTKKWEVDESNATKEMKKAEPTITKTVPVFAQNQVEVGEVVTYQLEVTVPSYPNDSTTHLFDVTDTMGAGLEFQAESIRVFQGEGDTPIEGDNNFTVSEPGENDAWDFKINFKEPVVTKYEGQKLKITYDAKVTAQAFEPDALRNTATLTYSNDPYGVKPTEKTSPYEIYTYGITVNKRDNATPLSGAVFTLAKAETEDTHLTFSGSNGKYTYDSEGTETELVVNNQDAEKGKLELRGLDVGTYVLKEITAPDGYVLPTGEIRIVVEDAVSENNRPDGTIDDSAIAKVEKTGTMEFNDVIIQKNVISLDVENVSDEDAAFDLPYTGGMGTLIFTVVGILLMGGAAIMVLMISRRKKSSN